MIENIAAKSPLIDEKLKKELENIFSKLSKDILLCAVLNIEEEKGKELAGFLSVIASLNPHIALRLYAPDEKDIPVGPDFRWLPVTGLYIDETYSGIAFHGVPGGHEINPFVLSIYNLAGPGQDISRGIQKKIGKINQKINLKVCVSLACRHCPNVVAACQRIASLNTNVEAEMIDAALYPDLIEKYNIERVPMVIVNDADIYVGAKDIEELLDIIKHIGKNR